MNTGDLGVFFVALSVGSLSVGAFIFLGHTILNFMRQPETVYSRSVAGAVIDKPGTPTERRALRTVPTVTCSIPIVEAERVTQRLW